MFEVFNKTETVWEKQLNDIKTAKTSIYLEQYILQDLEESEIGRKYINLLCKKAREGIVVKVILDAQGSFGLFKNLILNNQLKEDGVIIYYYKTLGWSRLINPARIFLRDHRKLLIVDENITWLGGVVIGESFRDWDDLMVRFLDEKVGSIMSDEFKKQVERLQDRLSLLAPMNSVEKDSFIVGNAPGIGNRFCYDEIVRAIMLAKESVTVVTPYFSLPVRLLRVINRRLAEGLTITLLIPQKSDNHLADVVREGSMVSLVKNGLKLYYSKKMNHAKIVLVDDKWLTFGSTNLDFLSLLFNHELNYVTTKPELIKSVKQVIHSWLEGLRRIEEGDCEFKNNTLIEKFFGHFISDIV